MQHIRLLSLSVAITFGSYAQASSYRAQCIGNGGKASIVFYTSGDKLIMNYGNSRGAVDFPFYEGTVTKASLPFIKMAEKELSEIDHEISVSWPVKKCTFNEETPLLMNCNGAGTFIVPEKTKLETYTLTTTKTVEESLTYSYETFKVRWGVEGENLHHSIVMPFDPKNCMAEYIK